MRNKAISGAAFAAILLLLNASAGAAPVFSGPGLPNQNWTGSLGIDFTVNTPIVIDALGAYSGPNASAEITVEIFTSAGSPVSGLLTTILTSSSPYTWQPVTPVTLAPGAYQVTAWGYGQIGNFNTGISPGTDISFNTLAGAITEGLPYYNNPNVTGFATILDNFNDPEFNAVHYYGAGNFDASPTPLPSTWLMLVSGFAGFGFLAYRGRRKNSALIAAA